MTMQEYDDSASYAEGTQKKVSGEVIRWHHKTGPVRVSAEQHIQALENEVKVLKQQVSGDLNSCLSWLCSGLGDCQCLAPETSSYPASAC